MIILITFVINIKMSLTSEYFRCQQFYEKKFGPKTIVLFQKGAFYEMYEFDPTVNLSSGRPNFLNGASIGHASLMSKIINITLTSADKGKPHTMDNPYMLGFPYASYERNKNILLELNWTIVRYDETDKKAIPLITSTKILDIDNIKTLNPKSNEGKVRELAEIVSPGTNTESNSENNNYLLSIYIECQKIENKHENHVLTCGISSIDLTTGSSYVGEICSNTIDPLHVIHELYRYLSIYNPRELIINVKYKDTNKSKSNSEVSSTFVEEYKKFLYKTLELDRYEMIHFKVNQVDQEYLKITYHEQFLSKIYKSKSTSSVSVIEDLDLERLFYGTVSFVVLLQFCYERSELLVNKLQKPNLKWLDENKHLVLTHNAIEQLNLLSNSTGKKDKVIDSLFSVVNNTSTNLGERYLKNLLLNPITDIAELNIYYSMVEELIENSPLMLEIEKKLSLLCDLEKYHRKLVSETIKPNELCSLFKSYYLVVDICRIIIENEAISSLFHIFLTDEDIQQFNACINSVSQSIDLDILNECKLTNDNFDCNSSFIFSGLDEYSDNYQDTIQQSYQMLDQIRNLINDQITSKGRIVDLVVDKRKKTAKILSSEDKKTTKVLETKDKKKIKEPKTNKYAIDISLTTTTSKGNSIKAKSSVLNNTICGSDLQVVSVKSNEVMIVSDNIEKLSNSYVEARYNLETYLHQYYLDLVKNLSSNYTFYHPITKFLAQLDYVKSNAKTAIKYKYFKPTIDTENKEPYMAFRDIRHPIVERIIEHEYIVNDIKLGDKPYGLLLYGCNSQGKTTMAKALALNLIMAQSGMYVACHLTYRPYTHIITRLSGNDNILKGHSSFIVEMLELKTILTNSNKNTLVIGDELCRGTESMSGTALTMATILTLLKNQCTFIFSTHMHGLVDTEELNQLDKGLLTIKHLAMKYDGNDLIYDRKLKDGPGSSMYGLEVAKSLSLDKDFIELSNTIRKKMASIPDKILNTKKSRYNSKLYVDSCSVCGLTVSGDTQKPLETHHIVEQANADQNDYINHFHKNSKFNLMVLCDGCHLKIHNKLKD